VTVENHGPWSPRTDPGSPGGFPRSTTVVGRFNDERTDVLGIKSAFGAEVPGIGNLRAPLPSVNSLSHEAEIADFQRLRLSPLTDSNRRPPPYHCGYPPSTKGFSGQSLEVEIPGNGHFLRLSDSWLSLATSDANVPS
jgi:hypothetical protein